jgi:HNH endonuclease
MTNLVITNGREVGKNPRYSYAQDTCTRCGLTRWVQKGWLADRQRRHAHSGLCRACADYLARPLHGSKREANPNWKGGRSLAPDGYWRLRLLPDDPFYCMTHQGAVREHRYVVAKTIGRPLEPWEAVHHRNGIKTDNGLENLELLSGMTDHLPDLVSKSWRANMESRLRALEQRITFLEAENALLRAAVQ